jgi:hypothetical protein
MATQVERETSDPREERHETEPEEERELTYDGGFVRLELPGTEPNEE